MNVPRLLKTAITRLETERAKVDHQIEHLTAAIGRKPLASAVPRKQWTDAQRAAVSKRMKRYWRERRKAS